MKVSLVRPLKAQPSYNPLQKTGAGAGTCGIQASFFFSSIFASFLLFLFSLFLLSCCAPQEKERRGQGKKKKGEEKKGRGEKGIKGEKEKKKRNIPGERSELQPCEGATA